MARPHPRIPLESDPGPDDQLYLVRAPLGLSASVNAFFSHAGRNTSTSVASKPSQGLLKLVRELTHAGLPQALHQYIQVTGLLNSAEHLQGHRVHGSIHSAYHIPTGVPKVASDVRVFAVLDEIGKVTVHRVLIEGHA
ncbi:hypothetical protein VTO73DRAFT_4561 [Trametes versicolor]